MNDVKIILKQILFILILAILNYEAKASTPGLEPLGSLKNLQDWEIVNQQNYNKENLFEFIDGEADIHFTYNFQELTVLEFEFKHNKLDSPKETVPFIGEIYKYKETFDAYGIFSLLSRGRKKTDEAGILSSYSQYNLIFYKGNYFVSIRSSNKIEKKYFVELGKVIADLTPAETSTIPQLIKYIPDKNIDKNNLVYFHHKKILNQFKYFNKNIFALNEKTSAVVSTCIDSEKTLYLLIEYPDKEICNKVYKTVIDKGRNILDEPEIFIQREGKIYFYVSKTDKFLISIIDTHNEKESINLIKLTIHLLQKSVQ